MLERSRIWCLAVAAIAAGCAVIAPPPEASPPPAPAPAPAPAPVVQVPEAPVVDHAAEESRSLLAQAETDVHRARAKRALWQKAWEDLVVARQAAAARDHRRASLHARRASELARLGLEQLAFPAVR